MKKHILLAAALVCAMMMTGCGNGGEPNKPAEPQGELHQSVADCSKPIGIYTDALNFLYQQDEGLNDGIELVAFDFSKCGNLTADEKKALMKYLSEEWDVPYIESDIETLKADGQITVDENGFTRFEKGILVTIETDGTMQGAEDKEAFTFTVGKYRTSLGAYWLSDCTATFDGKEWQYEIGTHMIS